MANVTSEQLLLAAFGLLLAGAVVCSLYGKSWRKTGVVAVASMAAAALLLWVLAVRALNSGEIDVGSRVVLTIPVASLTFHIDRLSAVFLFVVPFVAYFFFLVPYGALRQKSAWMKAFSEWSQPVAWLMFVAVCVWGLESVYSMAAPHLPLFFTSYAEKYLVKISGTVLGIREVDITGRLGALIGLIVGGYLFVSRGVAARAT